MPAGGGKAEQRSPKTLGAGNEIQLTHSMIRLLKNQKFFSIRYQGKTYDIGSKISVLMANVAYALKREDLSDVFAKS